MARPKIPTRITFYTPVSLNSDSGTPPANLLIEVSCRKKQMGDSPKIPSQGKLTLPFFFGPVCPYLQPVLVTTVLRRKKIKNKPPEQGKKEKKVTIRRKQTKEHLRL
jgi:hypothetical protein